MKKHNTLHNKEKRNIGKSEEGKKEDNIDISNQTSKPIDDEPNFLTRISFPVAIILGSYLTVQINNIFSTEIIEIKNYISGMSEKVEAIFQSETDLELLNLQNIESTLNVFQFSTLNDKSDNFRKIQLDYSSIDSLKENIIVLSHEINNPIFIAGLDGKTKDELTKILYRVMFQNTLNRVLSEYNSENNWSQKFVKDSNLKHLANSDKYYSYDIKYKADIQEEYSIFKTKYNKRNVIKRHYNSRDREPLRIVDYSYTIYEEEIIGNIPIGIEKRIPFKDLATFLIKQYHTARTIDEKTYMISFFLNQITRFFIYSNNSEKNIINNSGSGIGELDFLMLVHYFLQGIGVEHTGVNLDSGEISIKINIGKKYYIIPSFKESTIGYWIHQYHNYNGSNEGEDSNNYENIDIFELGGKHKITSEGKIEDFLISELFLKQSYEEQKSDNEFSEFSQRVEHFSRLAYVFNPDSFKNIDKLIQHFIEIERYDKAIEFLKKLEELYPDSKNVLLINKRSYQRMKYDDISKEYSQKYEAQFYFENIVKEQLSPEQEEKLKNGMDRNLQEQEEKYKEVKHLLEYDVINDIGVVIYKGNPYLFYKLSQTGEVTFYSRVDSILENENVKMLLLRSGYELKDNKIFTRGKELTPFLDGKLNSDYIVLLDSLNFIIELAKNFFYQNEIESGKVIDKKEIENFIDEGVLLGTLRIKDIIFYGGKGYIDISKFNNILDFTIKNLPKQCEDMRFHRDIGGERIGAEIDKDELSQYLKPAEGPAIITQSTYDECLKRIEMRDSRISEMIGENLGLGY